MIRKSAPLVVAAVLALGLAACQGPSDGGGDSPDSPSEGEFERDPWLTDDLENDAYLADGVYQGLTMVGFGCEAPEYFTADSLGDTFTPSASAYYGPEQSGISWINADGISDTTGPGVPTPSVPGSVTITGTDGIYDIGDGGTNTPGWTDTATFSLRSVPVPDDNGCTAMLSWFQGEMESGTPVEEMFRVLTEVGPDPAPKDCREKYDYTWLPTGWDCERFAEYWGDA